MSNNIRVRFAPSPTGPLHIGGVRTALYNYLFAKKNQGTFILRIEDTDQKRYVKGSENYILDTLEWCNLTYDEGVSKGGEFGPYRQSERKEIYQKYAQQLVDSGNAYYAFDTPEELDKMRERLKNEGSDSLQYNSASRKQMKNSLTLPPDVVKEKISGNSPYVVRLLIPNTGEIGFSDLIRGPVTWQCNQLDDKVLLKADGLPTYHLANVVDDYLMKVSHVIRGEEWLPSAPIHILLYHFLGWKKNIPEMAHLPLILNPNGKGKLSKRDGEKMGYPVFPLDWEDPETGKKSIGFREIGFFPDAFINMLAFLGWNPGTTQEIFSLDQLMLDFSLEKVGKAGAKFDFEKAKWFNQEYIKLKDDNELANILKPLLEKNGIVYDEKYTTEITGLLKERIEFIPDFLNKGNYFFTDEYEQDEIVVNKKWDQETKQVFVVLIKRLLQLEPFTPDNIETTVKDILEELNLKFGDILPLFRVMLTGKKMGPSLFHIGAILGKDKCIKRMEKSIHSFDKLTQ